MSENQTRIVQLLIGDYSDDGHGKTEAILAEITGRDVSNSALAEANLRAEALTGVKIEDLCEGYNDFYLKYDELKPLLVAGLELWPSEPEKLCGSCCSVKDRDMKVLRGEGFEVVSDDIDVAALLMAFLGHGIEGFSYRILPKDDYIVVGGYGDSPISNFGYGLFV